MGGSFCEHPDSAHHISHTSHNECAPGESQEDYLIAIVVAIVVANNGVTCFDPVFDTYTSQVRRYQEQRRGFQASLKRAPRIPKKKLYRSHRYHYGGLVGMPTFGIGLVQSICVEALCANPLDIKS